MVFLSLQDIIALNQRGEPDVLSDVLAAVRLKGAIFFDNVARGVWVSAAPTVAEVAAFVLPGCERIIPFHLITAGSCWMEIIDDPAATRRLVAGGLVILAGGEEHLFASVPGMREPLVLEDYLRVVERSGAPVALVANSVADGPETCRFICGYVGCDARPFNPLLDALPPVIVAQPSAESRELLVKLVQEAVAGSPSDAAGRLVLLERLAELMFVDTIRRYIEELPDGASGWLAALKDSHIGTALGLLHSRPAEPWTLEALARHAALSRSAFAERFVTAIGMPPMQYLARWRLQLASRRLAEPGANIARVAVEVGYESEAAFRRAFKKHIGVPPGTWRKEHHAASST